jgi:hypothetical protein
MSASETVNFLRTFNRWRRGDITLEQPSPQEIGEMIDAACNEIERLARQQERIHYDNFLSMQDERDQWREFAESLVMLIDQCKGSYLLDGYKRACDMLAKFEQLKEKTDA